jgi:hypothetical protein
MTLYDLIESAVTTKYVRADGTPAPVLARSRRAPMRSAVKRYGAFLGIDPRTATPDAYHLPEHEIRALIDTKAPETLAANTRRNLANDLVALLRLGVEQGWLAPLPAPLLSWKQRLPKPRTTLRRPEECPPRSRYALAFSECPPALQEALTGYIRWCEAPVMRNRDRKIVKRPVSSRMSRHTILRLAGFAVHELHQPIDTLTLEGLCTPDLVEAFASWWLDRRGRMTLGLDLMLRVPITIARHWLKDASVAKELTQLCGSLPPIEPVYQKDQHWLSLQQLEDVALSLYPRNARRLQEFPTLRKPSYQRTNSKRRTSFYVGFSLVIRLLIRLPMRQRCIREMAIGKNLIQDRAGVWHIKFVGTELKIERSRGAVNRYEFPFPTDLVPLLEEWLTDWRPKLASPDERHVFLNTRGQPFTEPDQISDMMMRTTYRFTGVSVNPHMIRDIWATEYLNTHHGDVMGCARRLGNTPEMVMRHYAHIIQKDADARAEAFLQGTFAEANGKGKTR